MSDVDEFITTADVQEGEGFMESRLRNYQQQQAQHQHQQVVVSPPRSSRETDNLARMMQLGEASVAHTTPKVNREYRAGRAALTTCKSREEAERNASEISRMQALPEASTHVFSPTANYSSCQRGTRGTLQVGASPAPHPCSCSPLFNSECHLLTTCLHSNPAHDQMLRMGMDTSTTTPG